MTRLRTPTPVVEDIFFRRFGGGGAERFARSRFVVIALSSASDHSIFSPSVV